jgi:hypothetical protein
MYVPVCVFIGDNEPPDHALYLRWRPILAICAMAVFLASAPASAETWSFTTRWYNPFTACDRNCAVHVSIGRFADEKMSNSFGFSGGLLPDAGDYVAPWNYDFENSFLLSGSFSRRVLTVGSWFSAELEAGIGQRFGDMHATELWGAVYLRWHAFPWNNYLRTTIAISTGLNYATQIDELERLRDDNGTGSNLLHYLSPEITFALPEYDDWELVLRFHHRSGGGNVFGDSALFGGVTGASNFPTIGIRHRF